MEIIFTNKRAFLVVNQSFEKVVRRRRSLCRITILFNMVDIIDSISRILASFFADIENNILHIFLNTIIGIILSLSFSRCNRGSSRSRLLRRIVTSRNDLTSISVVIIMEKGLHKFSALSVLTLNDNVMIVGIIVEHADSIIRFVFTDRSTLFSKSETEMRFIRTLNDIFEKIVFSIFVTFDILEDEKTIDVIREEKIVLIRTERG